ncbi:MAG TPA: right-handed parallel beta-helix repeat-containing protein [Solirubrobacterales bacterium]|jgi:hypothetical protein|nr:right-handed parallel beta-helix repeat-containing protein [Solirubrobacterales bacterium]
MLVLPGLASALTIEVTTIEDKDESEFAPCTLGSSILCSFREAIIQANETPAEDSIHFSQIAAGTELKVALNEFGSLPAIEEPLTIDGGTAAGAGGDIGIALTPGESEGGSRGLEVVGASDVVIEGLAIGGFNPGIEIEGSEDVTLCNDYIGLELDGVTTRDNVDGVLVGPSAENVNIGGLLCADNVISGNEEYGVVIEGDGTEVTGNLIGTDAGGEVAVPNGAGGIKVEALANDTEIRMRDDGEGTVSSNLIAHNGGPGVTIASGESLTGVFGNSIFANNGLGIQILADDEVPAPVLTGLATPSGSTTVSGTLSGAAPNGIYAFDFYANSSCDPSGSGEGEAYLGDSQTLEADAGGSLSFSTTGLDELPVGQSVITATTTEVIPESFEQVSEFSQCFSIPAPPAPPAPFVGPPAPPTPGLEPVNGELLVAATQSGTIKIKVPGQNKFKTLGAGEEIPVGSVVDATRGKVTLTSVNKAGETQTAVFYGGKFLIAQKEGAGLVVLKLRGGDFSSCGSASGSAATASGKSGRKLWGSGKGKFRTEGSYGSATVRGTVWLTEDRCSGTFFKTKKGVVSIRDFVAGTNFSLPAGKSYLAKKEG